MDQNDAEYLSAYLKINEAFADQALDRHEAEHKLNDLNHEWSDKVSSGDVIRMKLVALKAAEAWSSSEIC